MSETKKKKQHRRIACGLFLAGFFALCATGGAFASGLRSQDTASVSDALDGQEVLIRAVGEQEGIDLSFAYGYQDIAKSGRYLPVTIGIKNNTEKEIEGVIELAVPEAGELLMRYSYEITLPPGAKTEHRATVSLTGEAEELVLRLCDRSGTLLAERREELGTLGSGNELLIGLLSNTPQELSWLRGISIANSALRTRTVTLNPEDIPTTEEGLSQLDVIVISNYSMQKLSPETARVIYDWVQGGGALLLGTGTARDPLGGFSEYLTGVEIEAPSLQDVNMGMRYSTEGPDGAVIALLVNEIYADGGIQAIQSGDLAVLTTVSEGSGVIGLTAYDLCDIRAFCTEQIGYTDELLQALLGSARLKHIAAQSQNHESEYTRLSGLVNLWDPERTPNMSFYFVAALSYVLLVGPGCYFFLRQRGVAVYYPLAAIMISVAAAVVIRLLGAPTRFDGPYLEYAEIRELSGEKINETEIISLASPKKKPVELRISPEWEIQPLIKSGEAVKTYDGLSRKPERKEIGIFTEEAESRIRMSGMEPFESGMFELYRSGVEAEAFPVEISLSCFDDELSGTVKNSGDTVLEDAALLMYGRIVKIGRLAPGETVDLSGSRMIYGPTGADRLTSAYVTGLDRISKQDFPAYVRALSRTELLSYYMQESLANYYSGARFIAFSESKERLPSMETDYPGCHGTTLIVDAVQFEDRQGGEVSRSALSVSPTVISGEYEAGSNTTGGSAAVVIEYSLGTDLEIRSLRLNELSEEFSERQDGEGRSLIPFRGTRAFYNYATGSYDAVPSGKNRFEKDEIAPYLSPGNTLMIRYQPDETAPEGSLVFLPVPTVTGVEK